jgi:hypothetical protein
LSDEGGPRREPFFTCGSLGSEAAAGRRVATFLARLGQSAVPDIEQALTRIEERGRQSGFADNAFWLLQAYAKADGPAALPRLSGMIANPNLGFLRSDLDAAAALALGLTSYVDSLRRPTVVICRPPEPRDALDGLVLAWQADDRASVEAALGPKARSALNGKFQEHLRAAFPPRKPGAALAIGYKFDVPGPWSQPVETLDEQREGTSSDGAPSLSIETLFKNGSGGDCGRHRVQFLAPGTVSADGRYLVDNADIAELLKLVAYCSSEVGRKP